MRVDCSSQFKQAAVKQGFGELILKCTHFHGLSKQCRHLADAASCGVCYVSTLFVIHLAFFDIKCICLGQVWVSPGVKGQHCLSFSHL